MYAMVLSNTSQLAIECNYGCRFPLHYPAAHVLAYTLAKSNSWLQRIFVCTVQCRVPQGSSKSQAHTVMDASITMTKISKPKHTRPHPLSTDQSSQTCDRLQPVTLQDSLRIQHKGEFASIFPHGR